MNCRGTTCLTMVFITSCRGISALVPGAPPPPSFLTDLGVCRILTHLSGCKERKVAFVGCSAFELAFKMQFPRT